MFSLNLANMAITSALAVLPLSVEQSTHHNAQSFVATQNAIMTPELRETLIVAEALLRTFHQIASHDHTAFERLAKVDLALLFTQSDRLIQALTRHLSTEEDRLLLSRFSQAFAQTNQLYQAIEYKKEADKVLLSRVDSPVAASFDTHSSDDELRAFIFGA